MHLKSRLSLAKITSILWVAYIGIKEALLNDGLNFILQLITVLGIKSIVMMEVAEIACIIASIRPHLLRPLNKLSILDLHKNLSLRSVKRCVLFEPLRRIL